MYKSQLPFISVYNKTDVVSHEFAEEWMTDFEAFQLALSEDTSYMASLVQSMALVLEEFYKQITVKGVSSMTGEGMDELFQGVDEKVIEYENEYFPEIRKKAAEKANLESEKKRSNIEKFMTDLKIDEKE
jgi:hypothetical protein